MAAKATATARFLRHHVMRCRRSLATPLATAVAVAVDTISDTAQYYIISGLILWLTFKVVDFDYRFKIFVFLFILFFPGQCNTSLVSTLQGACQTGR